MPDKNRKLIDEFKALGAPAAMPSPRATKVSQFEKDYRNSLAREQAEREQAVKAGLTSWVTEIPGFVADLAVDAPYYLGQRAMGRRGDAIRPLGYGERVRAELATALGLQNPPSDEVGMRPPPANENITDMISLANPLAWSIAGDPIGLSKIGSKAFKSVGKGLGREAGRRIDDAMMTGEGMLGSALSPARPAFAVTPKGQQATLSAAESAANLERFLSSSAEKRRMYHGSKEDIKEFKTRKDMTDESYMTGHYADERDAVFLSPDPEFTKHFSQMGYTDANQAPSTYPVYVQAQRPFDFDNPVHLEQVKKTYLDMYHNPESDLFDPYLLASERSMDQHTFNKRVDSLPEDENNWAKIENQKFQDVLKDLNFDSFYTRERGTKNLGIYEPNRIKSAIGNRGTYDLAEDDITKAKGGPVSQDAMQIKAWDKQVQHKGMGGWMKDLPRTAQEAKRLFDIAKGTRSKAAQEAAGLYHPIGGGIKLSKPVELMQFETVKDPTVKGVQRRIITPEDMQGGIGIPLVGDRAAGGKLLTGVEGTQFRNPLTLEAGPDYMLTHTIPGSPESSIWRSGKGVISGLQNQIEFARDMGRPIYGVNVVGAPTNVNYNTMVTEAILNQYDPASMTKKSKKEFLKDIRNYTPDPDKPHLKPGSVLTEADLNDVEALRAKMLAEGAGPLRKAFVERMGQAPFQEAGFPDVPASRLATTEPLLVDVPTGSAGFTVGTIDPAARALEQTPRGHKTYPISLAGEYFGSLDRPIDYRDIFQEFGDKRRAFGKPEGSDWRSFSLAPQFQTFDQEWLDRVMKSAGADKPREWKNGGAVNMASGGKMGIFNAIGDILVGKAKVKIRPPSDNVANVRDANFQYPRMIGNQTVNIGDLKGGVRFDKQERQRVNQLADKIVSPDGYISRIIVDHDNNVVEGQHRLEALRKLGATEVPVYKIEDLADTMPIAQMESAIRSVGAIHSDHSHQLMQHVLNDIAEHGIEGAREMDAGAFQKFYDAALDAATPKLPKGQQAVLPAPEAAANLETARDMVIMGDTHAGKKDGGAVHMAEGGQSRQPVDRSLPDLGSEERLRMEDYLRRMRFTGSGSGDKYGTGVGGRAMVNFPVGPVVVQPYVGGGVYKPQGGKLTGGVSEAGVNLVIPFADGGEVSADDLIVEERPL